MADMWHEDDVPAVKAERPLSVRLIRGTPFKTIIAPLLAADAVVHKE